MYCDVSCTVMVWATDPMDAISIMREQHRQESPISQQDAGFFMNGLHQLHFAALVPFQLVWFFSVEQMAAKLWNSN